METQEKVILMELNIFIVVVYAVSHSREALQVVNWVSIKIKMVTNVIAAMVFTSVLNINTNFLLP
ncbi:MAG: hypothetical protein ACREHC_06870 [Candidatus Levyibacteriota bacterium]